MDHVSSLDSRLEKRLRDHGFSSKEEILNHLRDGYGEHAISCCVGVGEVAMNRIREWIGPDYQVAKNEGDRRANSFKIAILKMIESGKFEGQLPSDDQKDEWLARHLLNKMIQSKEILDGRHKNDWRLSKRGADYLNAVSSD